MKKLKSIFFFLSLVALMVACEDDGGTSKLNVKEGGIPDIQTAEGSEAFLNLLQLQEGNPISITFTADVAWGDVASMDVVGYYISASGGVEKAILANDVTTFPTTITVTNQDLIDLYTVLGSNDDFMLGDQLKVSAELTLENGDVLPMLTETGGQNYGADVSNSTLFSVVQVYNVSCPSNLAGTYSSLSSGTSTDPGPTPDENPISDFASTVILTDNGGGSYGIDDPYGGVYHLWYDIYGVTPGYPVDGTITDVCGTISGSFTEPFGTTTEVTGTVSPDGIITYSWVNGYGDTGTVVLTPQ